MAPAEPGAFPGRNTAATKYCSASSSKVRKQPSQVTVAIVVAIEKGELLLAVRGVVGGIQIDGDATSATMQTLAMSSITQSASASVMRKSSLRSGAFSKRDRVVAKPDPRQRGDPTDQQLVGSDHQPTAPHRWRLHIPTRWP